MISDVIDMFGSNVVFSDETDEHVTVSARVNERVMWQFAKKAVWDYINRLRIDEGYERREQHDASFLATAENVINAFAGYGDDDSSFGFGNAQKLINMTAKYIALGIYMDDCREDFQYCHCPMDGIMVDKVTKLAGRLVDEGERTPCFAGEFRIQAPTCPRLGGQGRSPLEQADPREPKTI